MAKAMTADEVRILPPYWEEAKADIAYVNAHGTGTRANDRTEVQALRAVFGEAVPPVSSASRCASAYTCADCDTKWQRPPCDSINAIFDALVDAVISDAREQGLRAIGLHVYRANERAAAAYRRRGFRLVENPTAECPADEAEYLLPL